MTRLLPKVDVFKAKIVEDKVKSTEPPKDGIAPLPSDDQLDIDSLMKEGLKAILGIIRHAQLQSRMQNPSRESVQSLKDAMAMLHALKKEEADLVEDLDDEELEKLVKR